MGNFQLDFRALPGDAVEGWGSPLFLFTVNVDVVDITGETHSASRVIRLSENALHLGVNLPGSGGEYDKSEPFRLGIRTTNLDYQFIARECTLRIVRMEGPDRPLITRYWERPDLYKYDQKFYRKNFPGIPYKLEGLPEYAEAAQTLHQQVFTSEEDMSLSLETAAWPTGEYQVVLQTRDDKDNEMEVVRQLTVYDSSNDEVPVGITLLTRADKTTYQPGDEAAIQVLKEDNPGHAFVMFGRNGEILAQKWHAFAGQTRVSHEVSEEDRGGLYYQVNYIRNNRQHTEVHKLPVPWTEKELKVEMITFRDKLLPGQEEEWQLKISGEGKDGIAAELLASMYDASLDAFAPNVWNFFPYRQNGLGSLRWDARYFYSQSAEMFSSRPQTSFSRDPDLERAYRQLNWFEFFYRTGPVAFRSRAATTMAMELPQMEAEPVADESAAGAAEYKSEGDAAAPPPPPPPPEPEENAGGESVAPPVRTNLDETVFFLPELYTDPSGNVIIKFTMNEALTRWKFMAFAHTEDLELGQITREVVTQKELMIQPNAPRFLREGDLMAFTAKVSNLTDREISGRAKLELFDAQTMQPVSEWFSLEDGGKDFTLDPNRSEALSWEIRIPQGKVSALTYRVSATAGDLGDGEENALPVVPNRMLVTESIPLSVRGKEKRSFSLTSLKNSGESATLQPHRLTLELSSNPAWYAVQALPYLMEFPHECTEQLLNRLFANSLAALVVENRPAIRDLFESWKGTDALLSNLSKNEQLKSVLLEETPWVMQAQSEEQQKQQIALLFDLQRMANEKNAAIDKLQQRQSATGGFSWFPGGRDSWYITQYLVEGFGRLQELGANSSFDPAAEMVGKAIGFIDSEAVEYYRRIAESVAQQKTKWEDDHLSAIAIHYLYTRSYYLQQAEMDEETKKVYDYFSAQSEQYWLQKSLYQQAMIGLAAHRQGKRDLVAKIARSLQEKAIKNEELGVYWKYNRGYFWHQLPIETHTTILEFFAESGQDGELVEEMKIWLLKNKQTNHWKTTKATAAGRLRIVPLWRQLARSLPAGENRI